MEGIWGTSIGGVVSELVFVKTTFICENVEVRVPSEMKRESQMRDNGIVEESEENTHPLGCSEMSRNWVGTGRSAAVVK